LTESLQDDAVAQMATQIPSMVDFTVGTKLDELVRVEEAAFGASYVVMPDGKRIELPADQVVHSEDRSGFARVGFGGLSFEGIQEGQLVFWRVKDLLPEDMLSPSRSLRVLLDPTSVSRIQMNGQQVWPKP
jgi:hypothetical protein